MLKKNTLAKLLITASAVTAAFVGTANARSLTLMKRLKASGLNYQMGVYGAQRVQYIMRVMIKFGYQNVVVPMEIVLIRRKLIPLCWLIKKAIY